MVWLSQIEGTIRQRVPRHSTALRRQAAFFDQERHLRERENKQFHEQSTKQAR
jgi:hypothetical protein